MVCALATALAVMLVSGCAVNGGPSLSSAGDGIPPGATVAIAPPHDGDPYAEQFAAALTDAMRQRSFGIADDGQFVVQYGIAVRDATIGLATAGSNGEVEDISAERKRLLFDGCKAQRLRLTMTVVDRQQGSIARRSALEADGCAFSPDEVAGLADRLAAIAAR